MEVIHRTEVGNDPAVPVAERTSRVILALDHFSAAEREAIERAARAFVCSEAPGTRLPGAEPLYLLRATPDLLLVVRREAGRPLVVEDIATQAAWDALAHAG